MVEEEPRRSSDGAIRVLPKTDVVLDVTPRVPNNMAFSTVWAILVQSHIVSE